jgi:hypothetical protein
MRTHSVALSQHCRDAVRWPCGIGVHEAAVASKQTGSFGSWSSPITADAVVAGALSLLEPRVDGEDIYWIEARPLEKGRNVVVIRAPDGTVRDITPPAFNARTQVVRACPRGVDVYFHNTAGAISDVVLPQLAIVARVVICGTASVSSWDPPPMGPRVERHLVKRARMAGILVFDYQHRYEEAVTRLAEWVRQGHLCYREDIVDGIENCPGAIAGLYRGENLGKRLIHLRNH